jgi:hypothetical protein
LLIIFNELIKNLEIFLETFLLSFMNAFRIQRNETFGAVEIFFLFFIISLAIGLWIESWR